MANGTGGITQGAGATVTVGGDTSLAASEDIILDDPTNDFGGPVSASTDGNLALEDANDLDLGTIDADGDVTVGAGDDVNFTGPVTVGGDAEVTAGTNGNGTGGITQGAGATVTVGGDTSLAASEDIILDDPMNDFGGPVSASTDGNLALEDANDLNLGTIDAGGDFDVNAAGDISGSRRSL